MSGGNTFSIGHDHPSLPGHFPGRPIVPGALVLEHVVAEIEATHGPLGPLRLPQVKFARSLLPGETARVEFEAVDATAARRWRFRVMHADGSLLASGEIAAA